MLKMYNLNLASRQLIINVLGTLEDLSGDVPHKVRTIRKTFELKTLEDEIDKLQAKKDEGYQVAMSAWNKAKAAAEAKEKDYTERPPRQPVINWDDLSNTPERKFTLDDIYVNWLLERAKEKDWRKVKDQQNKDQEINVSIDHLVAIADLQDALKGDEISEKPAKGAKNE